MRDIFRLLFLFSCISLLIAGCLDKADKMTYDQHIVISIERDPTGSNHTIPIEVSENIDYSSIYHIERYTTTEGISYEMPLNERIYVWANFIDNTSIESYQRRARYLEENDIDVYLIFNYTAYVYHYSFALINYSNGLLNISNINNESSNIKTYFNTIFFVAILDDSGNFTFGDSLSKYYKDFYVVRLYFDYNERYAPVAGFSTTVFQTIILDTNYDPFFISIFEQSLIY